MFSTRITAEIDNNAEIDRADGQKVRVRPHQHQNDNAEKQRERNVGADNNGAAQVAEKDPLDEENQQTTEDEIVQDRVGGDGHQRAAVVIGNELDARRQASIAVELVDLGLDARHYVIGMKSAVHDNDRQGNVVIMIAAGNTEPRPKADRDLGDVLHLHRNAIHLGEHDVLDVVDLPALGQIQFAAAVEQPDTADVHGLLADSDLASAHIDIGVAECADDLRNRNVVGVELVQIDLDIVLLGGAAPRVHGNDPRNSEQAAGDDPVLYGTQVGQPEVRRTDYLVAIDLTDQARALDIGLYTVRKADVLLQAQRRPRIGGVIIDAPFERDADERQPIERGRADIDDSRSLVETNFHGDRVVTLHLLSREAGRLGGDL